MHLGFLKRFYSDLENKKILDLGSGRGDFVLECLESGLKVMGLEVNQNYIDITQSKLREKGLTAEIVKGVGESLPWPNETFDFINSTEVLEHTQEPLKVLSECQRVLRLNGQMFITIHNRLSIRDGHFHKVYFSNWLPRSWAKRYIHFLDKFLNLNLFPTKRQEIDELHYYAYWQFKKIANRIGFSIKDLRKEQIKNPDLILNRKIVKALKAIKKIKLSFLLYFIYFFVKRFYFNTFHLSLTKVS